MGKASETIKNIIWDFDGVIVASNDIREKGFLSVLSSYPNAGVQSLLDFHRKNGGLSRYVKFRYFFEEILNETVSEKKVQTYANQFSSIMKKLMTNKEILIEETNAFIASNFKNYNFHIASGSDQTELRFLCGKLELSDYFISINGSPQPKMEIVKDIMYKYEYENSSTLLIGDAINDYEAAKSNKILFMAYNGVSALHAKSDLVLNLSSNPLKS